MSLAQLTAWCDERFGVHVPAVDPEPRSTTSRGWPWITRLRLATSAGTSKRRSPAILEEIAQHANRTSGLAGDERRMKSPPPVPREPLQLLSVVIPARNEEGCIAATVEHLHLELRLQADSPRNRGGRRRQHGLHLEPAPGDSHSASRNAGRFKISASMGSDAPLRMDSIMLPGTPW